MPAPLLRTMPLVLALFMAACDMGGSDSPSLPPDGGLSGSCKDRGAHCEAHADCCGSLTCNANKVCSDDASCMANGSHCSRSSECCGTATCDNGVCSTGACVANGGHCQYHADCCGSATCNSGICGTGTCVGSGAHCARSSDCCGSLVCGSNGTCR